MHTTDDFHDEDMRAAIALIAGRIASSVPPHRVWGEVRKVENAIMSAAISALVERKSAGWEG